MAAPDYNAIAQWVATTAQGADSRIRGSSPYPLDTIPGTPYAVVGPPPQTTVIHGSWERVHIGFPLRIYVGRIADASRNSQLVTGMVGNLIAAFRLGGTEGGTVASSLLDDIKTDIYEEIGSERYQVIDATVNVVVNDATGYTP